MLQHGIKVLIHFVGIYVPLPNDVLDDPAFTSNVHPSGYCLLLTLKTWRKGFEIEEKHFWATDELLSEVERRGKV